MLDSNTAVENWQLRPVWQFPGSFDHEHEHDLVADLGVRLRRA